MSHIVQVSKPSLGGTLATPPGVANGVSIRLVPPWQRAAIWLVFLGPFFFLSYGFANSWTAHLTHVDSVAFAWEKQIPFVPWTIVPYMSIDLFYAASLFLCATKLELDTHAKRLLLATSISVTGFLLFPLQFSFARPATDGIPGALFALLAGFDKPYNQAPSLHISLLMLLWVCYAKHLRGVSRFLLHVWFLLIGISVFTTYQHHFIDGVAGFVVGVLCLYVFPYDGYQWQLSQSNDRKSKRLACLYLSGTVVCASLAWNLRAWAWLMLWPAISCLLVSLAYAFFGVTIFQKTNGRLSWPAQWLLAPYRLCAWWSSRWLTRDSAPAVEICEGLWLGRAPSQADWHLVPVRAVLDLTAEFNSSSSFIVRAQQSVPMLDLLAPTVAQLNHAVAVMEDLRMYGPILVHCALGYSRSAIVLAAYLWKQDPELNLGQVVKMIQRARPKVVLSTEHVKALVQFQKFHGKSW